jgi:hypothetical protein
MSRQRWLGDVAQTALLTVIFADRGGGLSGLGLNPIGSGTRERAGGRAAPPTRFYSKSQRLGGAAELNSIMRPIDVMWTIKRADLKRAMDNGERRKFNTLNECRGDGGLVVSRRRITAGCWVGDAVVNVAGVGGPAGA